MSESQQSRTEELGELFVSVTGDEAITEEREGDNDREGVAESESFDGIDDGLDDAVDADLDASG